MTAVTDRNGVRPGDADRLDEEPVVPDNPYAQEQKQQQLAVGLGAAGVAALVAYLLWRLKLRRTPPTPSERVTEAARSVVDAAGPTSERLVEATKHLAGASLSAGGRAFERVTDTAAPVAGTVAGTVAETATDVAGKVAETASDVAEKAVEVGAVVGSGIAAVPEVIGDAAHGVHKFWRKWTLRILVALAAGLGYTAGAAAGRERYEQIVGAARNVAARPEVQQAQHKLMDAVNPDQGSPTA